MNYKVKNQKLGEELQRAEMAEGYLVLITRLNNGRLEHSYFTLKFPKDDVSLSLGEYAKLLQGEMGPTTFKKTLKRELPPEYRKVEDK